VVFTVNSRLMPGYPRFYSNDPPSMSKEGVPIISAPYFAAKVGMGALAVVCACELTR
jgi:hypothetical protein